MLKKDPPKTIKFEDFEIICRICLNKAPKLEPIFQSELVCYMLKFCNLLEVVYNDNYPSQICDKCKYKLENCYKLKQECIQSDSIIKRILNDLGQERNVRNSIKAVPNVNNSVVQIKNETIVKEEVEDTVTEENTCNAQQPQILNNTVQVGFLIPINTLSVGLPTTIPPLPPLAFPESSLAGQETESKPPEPAEWFKCDICSLPFVNRVELILHKRIHKNEIFKCFLCSKAFKRQGSLTLHINRTHKNPSTKFQCQHCELRFGNKKKLDRHQKIHQNFDKVEENCKIEIISVEDDFNFNRTCKICLKVFRTAATYNNHMEMHQNQTLGSQYKCSDCEKGFFSKYSLARHVVLHSGKKEFMCELCGNQYALMNDFRRHQFNQHKINSNPDFNETCNVCGKTFKTKGHLNLHVVKHLRANTKPKQYQCGRCDFTTKYCAVLKKHIQRHDNIKMFQCSYCPKKFFTDFHLKSHTRTHTGEKPFKCTECSKTFILKDSLIKHKRVHTGEMPYTCHYCGKKFRRISCMRVHLLTHTGEKNFQCTICGKLFARRINLNYHKLIHGEEKRFKCSFCEKAFKRRSVMIKHQKRFHKNQKK